MKTIIFVHDSKFYMENGEVFNNGNLSHTILKRYLEFNNRLLVVGRKEEKEVLKTRSSGENIEWFLFQNFITIKGILFGLKNIKKELEEIIQKGDLIIIRLPSFLGVLSYQIAKKYKKRIILEVVGSSLAALNGIKKYKLSYYKNLFYLGYNHYKTKKIVFDGEYVIYVTKKFLQNYYPNNKKNISCSDVMIEQVKKKRKNEINEKIKLGMIGFIGNKNKGLDISLKALEKLSDNYILEVIGEGDKNFWKKEIIKRKLDKKIKFLGEMPHENVLEWLEEIDIFLQPSYSEGLPRAIIEAMSRGCPVIGTNVGGIPELVNENLLIEKGNDKELLLKIKEIKNEKEFYSEYSINKAKEYLSKNLNSKRKFFINEVMDKNV